MPAASTTPCTSCRTPTRHGQRSPKLSPESSNRASAMTVKQQRRLRYTYSIASRDSSGRTRASKYRIPANDVSATGLRSGVQLQAQREGNAEYCLQVRFEMTQTEGVRATQSSCKLVLQAGWDLMCAVPMGRTHPCSPLMRISYRTHKPLRKFRVKQPKICGPHFCLRRLHERSCSCSSRRTDLRRPRPLPTANMELCSAQIRV